MTNINNMVIQTPLGKVEMGKQATPSSGVTVSVEKIEKEFKELSKKGIIFKDDEEDEETSSCNK